MEDQNYRACHELTIATEVPDIVVWVGKELEEIVGLSQMD